MEKTFNYLMNALKQIISHCQELQTAFLIDQENFSKNNLSMLDESNQKKKVLINKISTQTNELNTVFFADQNGSLLEKIEKYIDSMDAAKADEGKKILAAFSVEIAKCSHNIVVNNNIVHANIRNLKDLWDKLMRGKNESVCLYDHTGVTRG